LQVELGLREVRTGLLRASFGGSGASLGARDLSRRGLRRLQLGVGLLLAYLRLRELAFGDADAGFGFGNLRAG
jgi:hypothetical protein